MKTGLKLGSGLTASSFLASCSTFDRVILGGPPPDPNQVVILGAGLAGLTASYLCKKNGMPFVTYEGSSRIGGRVLSLRDFNSASQSADLGGEWIATKHESILKLAKELFVEVSETSFQKGEFAFFENGKWEARLSLQAELHGFQKKAAAHYFELFGVLGKSTSNNHLSPHISKELPRMIAQDAVSCEEFINKLAGKSSKVLPLLLRRQIQLLYGAEPSEVSSLSWLAHLAEPNEFSVFNSEPLLRVSGGSGVLAQALFDRVAGVIPGRFVNTSHRLVAVSEDTQGFELQFETAQGLRIVSTKRVICTLPISVLRNIRGIEKLSFQDSTHEMISQLKAGAQAKGILSFKERPWKKQMEVRRFSGSFETQNFWETEPRAKGRTQNTEITQRCILAFQLGGASALSAGLHSVEKAEKDLQALKLSSGFEGLSQIHNWCQSPWSEGGRSFFAPKQATQFTGALSGGHCGGKWFFAGEASSLMWPGTMNGAVDSAKIAFEQVSKLDRKRRSSSQ